jgi:hypothetical protein
MGFPPLPGLFNENLPVTELIKKLFLRDPFLVFDENRSDGPCTNGSPDKDGESAAVVNMSHLEGYNQSKAERRDTDQGVADDINHISPPGVTSPGQVRQ